MRRLNVTQDGQKRGVRCSKGRRGCRVCGRPRPAQRLCTAGRLLPTLPLTELGADGVLVAPPTTASDACPALPGCFAIWSQDPSVAVTLTGDQDIPVCPIPGARSVLLTRKGFASVNFTSSTLKTTNMFESISSCFKAVPPPSVQFSRSVVSNSSTP